MTVSNFSQAIHFLVVNDFLQNVELKPGDADAERQIEVLDDIPRPGHSTGVSPFQAL